MRRGILLSSRRSATRTYGLRDFARLAHACINPAALLGFSFSFAGLVPSPGDLVALSRWSGPHAIHLVILISRFR